jgi:FAD synthase
MSLPAQFDGLDRVALPSRPLHVAIGMFDGVHLGHRAVIESAVQSARHSGGVSVVLTFAPHPSVLFRPDNPTRMILDLPAKMAKVGSLGIDAIVVQPFTREFAAITAEEFVPFIKRHLPRLAGIYVGENFRFGKGRKGDVAGFPTLNLGWSPDLRPLYGVYAVRVSGAKSYGWLPAVANYGLRPTVEQSAEPRLEIHMLVACPYGAGDTVAVEWVRFIRPERKFGGLDELKLQIARDVAEARAEFSLP